MARSNTTRKVTRIQREKTDLILEAALDVFAAHGFRGATVDMIAAQAEISKPNVLYYFESKEAIHRALLDRLLQTWLEPLEQIDPEGEPIGELCAYVARKLEMSRTYPRESRLFANEILQGAPRILPELEGPLRALVEEKAALIDSWVTAGHIAPVNAEHLLFMIWATTQHYADFDAQIHAVLDGPDKDDHFDDAARHLDELFRRMLDPRALSHQVK